MFNSVLCEEKIDDVMNYTEQDFCKINFYKTNKYHLKNYSLSETH